MLTTQEIHTYVPEYIKKWAPAVGVADWEVLLNFNERKYLMTSIAMPQYERVQIAVNTRRAKKEMVDLEELERHVLHELCHAITLDACTAFEKLNWPVADDEYDLSDPGEVLTTRIERSIWRGYQLGKKEEQDAA